MLADTEAPESGNARFVYAIRDDARGALKIGFSTDPRRRLRQLQTGNAGRLRLISCLRADRAIESGLHELFADRGVNGEWFDDGDEEVSAVFVRLVAYLESGSKGAAGARP